MVEIEEVTQAERAQVRRPGRFRVRGSNVVPRLVGRGVAASLPEGVGGERNWDYGELLGAAHRLADQITDIDEDMRRFLVALADPAAARWRETVLREGWNDQAGAFTQSFSLAQALAMSGQVDRARRVFEQAAGYANDVGLLAEEIDPDTGELLGNFPQAFSHIGLVNAAWAVGDAERRAATSR